MNFHPFFAGGREEDSFAENIHIWRNWNIEAQIWYKFFPKTTKNSKFDHENFSDESLDQEKHFKHVFGVGVGCEF